MNGAGGAADTGVISRLRRRFAIKKYAKRLGPMLRQRYGHGDSYTRGQIETAARHARLPVAHICIGYAMFMGRDEFDRLHREIGQPCSYDAMRQDVADQCFSGNSGFSTNDAIAYGAAAGFAMYFGAGIGGDGDGGGGGGDGGD